ncbi:hypothetical protein AB0B05_42205, partial [Streptomyces chrestomyceticus]
MRRIPRLRTAALGVCASVALAVPAGTAFAVPLPGPSGPASAPRTSGDVPADQLREAREVQRYWTPERIRSAVPVETAEAGAKSEAGQPAPSVRSKRSAEPTHQVAEGIPTVGVFLVRGSDGSATPNQFCTASTVTSGSKSLVVTAAHCIKGNTSLRDAAFVPGYRAGAT